MCFKDLKKKIVLVNIIYFNIPIYDLVCVKPKVTKRCLDADYLKYAQSIFQNPNLTIMHNCMYKYYLEQLLTV
jgi:hypothetical protein